RPPGPPRRRDAGAPRALVAPRPAGGLRTRPGAGHRRCAGAPPAAGGVASRPHRTAGGGARTGHDPRRPAPLAGLFRPPGGTDRGDRPASLPPAPPPDRRAAPRLIPTPV